MKQPSSHMRRDRIQSNPESSAFETGTVGSDDNNQSNRKAGLPFNPVSDRYKRRRASAQSVKFTLPVKNGIGIKNKNKIFTDGLDSNEDDYDEATFKRYDFDRRRMSAPELPPINSSGKNSVLLNDGFLATRATTFYKLTLDGKVNRKSNYSDSSVQGSRLNSQSRTSSSSSRNSRTRVQSAGTDRRQQQQQVEVPKEKINSTPRLVPPTMKNGMTGVTARCGSTNGYRRTKSKLSLNNNSVATPRKLKHVHSESHLLSRDSEVTSNRALENPLKRNMSEKSLIESKKNMKNSQSAVNGRRKTTTNSNLNGMRKFSSTLGLTSDERKSDENLLNNNNNNNNNDNYDSDTDSEKDQRVIDWIIGVSEIAEPPEEPTIDYKEEPPQRDTAIRIVYDGDS